MFLQLFCPTCQSVQTVRSIDQIAGITEYQHGTHSHYVYENATYATLADAWLIARKQYVDNYWLAGQDALILEKNGRKAHKLFKKWRENCST